MPPSGASPSWLIGHASNPYFAFTDRCNAQRPEIILASGQACVWYRLTLASKDGDWLVREEEESLARVRGILADMGARYRLGAPLDVRWLRAGWSSHFEAIDKEGLRLRFDFVSRPPRVALDRITAIWREVEAGAHALVDREMLIQLKQTMRLKDYAFIGGLALQLESVQDQVRWTIDAEHLIGLLQRQPEVVGMLPQLRPNLVGIPLQVEAVAEAIDAEIRQTRRQDEHRMGRFTKAMQPFAHHIRNTEFADLPLPQAHELMCAKAESVLPQVSP